MALGGRPEAASRGARVPSAPTAKAWEPARVRRICLVVRLQHVQEPVTHRERHVQRLPTRDHAGSRLAQRQGAEPVVATPWSARGWFHWNDATWSTSPADEASVIVVGQK